MGDVDEATNGARVSRVGESITEEAIEASLLESEIGDTAERLSATRRARRRPRLGGDKKAHESVRLGSVLKSEAQQRAQAEGISV